MKTRKTLKIGSKILFRYFNKAEGKFYGTIKGAIVKDIFEKNNEKLFTVEYTVDETNFKSVVTLHRKEIKSILS